MDFSLRVIKNSLKQDYFHLIFNDIILLKVMYQFNLDLGLSKDLIQILIIK